MMGSRGSQHPYAAASRVSGTSLHNNDPHNRREGDASARTPVKQQQLAAQPSSNSGVCPYGSPISGVCSNPASSREGLPPAAASAASSGRHTPQEAQRSRADAVSSHGSGAAGDKPSRSAPAAAHDGSMQQRAARSPRHSTASRKAALPWTGWPMPSTLARSPSGSTVASDPWQQQQQQLEHPHQPHRHSCDNQPRRDQGAGPSGMQLVAVQGPGSPQIPGAAGSVCTALTATGSPGQQLQQLEAQPLLPLDVLLSPLLPSADEAKLLDRLSQLRAALQEQAHQAAGWQQQASSLQTALCESQQEVLGLQGQVATQQQHISLLGGNLQGRLSLVQGSVLAELQAQGAAKDAALAASEQQLAVIGCELERLSCSFGAKLAAEQAERQRLSAEAAQARLLCMARGRQVGSLQQEVQQLRDAASHQQASVAATSSVQQQQLEGLHQRLQQLQAELADARGAADDARHAVAAAEGGKAALRQQVEELQAMLADKQLQLEWLEGKLADLEDGSVSQQLKRHNDEVVRLQHAAAAERKGLEQQLAQLQQQEQGWQQQLAEQRSAVAQLQAQLAQQQQAASTHEQQLAAQQADAQVVQAELTEQLAAADAELQQLREELAAADQQLQQQERGGLQPWCEAGDGGAAASAAAVEHALRAQLGLVNAEVARLQHELAVEKASQRQERELTGCEIMRLQQELTEASSASAGAGGGGGGGASYGTAAAAVVAATAAAAPAPQDSSGSWHSVHDSVVHPALEQQPREAAAAPAAGATPVSGGRAAALSCSSSSPPPEAKLALYEERMQDQADTIASLQRQLKQQQQLLAALQHKDRRVHDSAASSRSWVEMLGLQGDDSTSHHAQHQQQQQPAAPTAAVPVVQQADAAIQTDLAGAAESAGSTAAVNGGAAAVGSDDAGDEVRSHSKCYVSAASAGSSGQRSAAEIDDHGAAAGDAASSALLAAARHEILRLQELHRQLLQTHTEELKASVSFADAQRAVAEAKQHAKAKAAAMLQAATKNWAARLSAAQAERQQLKDQLAQVQQQQEALAQQLSESQAAHASDVDKLQQQLAEAHARCTALQHQLHDVAYSHQQQLEQARLEAEAEAAAVMLDAAAAASKHHRHQQHRAQRQSCEVAVQADSPAALPVHDVSVQTDAQPHAQPAAAAASAGAQPPAKQAQPEAASNADAFGMRQAVHDVAAAPADASAVSDQAMNGHTQRPASLAVDSSCGAGTAAAEAATPHSRPLVSCWGGAAGVDAADDGDDLCRLSSASDTPVAAAHAKAGTISRAGSSSAHTAAPESFRPGSAAGATSAAPPAPSSLQGLRSIASSPVGGADGSGAAPAQHAVQPHQQPQQPHQQPQQPQQQPQQQQPLQQQPQQQQPQQREPVRTSIAGQMSGWHAELLEQQAQLETLRLRLSQAQQQQGAVSAGLGGSSSSGGFTKGCQAVASSRTLLLAPFATSIGGSEPSGGVGVAGSPAGPIRSSSSPMTYQQRRAATQQAADAAPGAGAWGMHSLQGAPVRLSFGAAGGAGAAAPLSSSPAYRQPLPAASGSPANGASSGASPGLARLGDDVLGGLSLSRYHRERSKLQEARAKQHALLATRHEDQAAALRSSASMLGGGGAGGGVASDAAAAVPLQDPSRVA